MRKLISLLAFATILLGPVQLLAIPRATDKAHLESRTNLLENPGAENGTARWTKSGSSTLTIETSAPLTGKQSLKWDPSATSETLESSLIVIPVGLQGNWCQLKFLYKWESGITGEITYQVHDGTNPVSTIVDLIPSSGAALYAGTFFSCPTSGSIKVLFSSTADAAEVTLDKNHLGEPVDVSLQGATELIAHAKYIATASCLWNRTNTSFGAFIADADCPAITVLHSTIPVNTADNDLPDLVFDNLPTGKYEVTVTFSGEHATSTGDGTFIITDGTNTVGQVSGRGGSGDTISISLNGVFEYTTSGARTFSMNAKSTATIRITNTIGSGIERELIWTVKRFPLNSTQSLNLNTQAWHIDANIGGGNPNLGTSAQASYIGITNSSLDLVLNTGSKPAEIACATTEESSGLTCSGDESLGISFTPPYIGLARACFSFSLQQSMDASDGITDIFQVVKTPNNAQTIDLEGNERISLRNTIGAVGGSVNQVKPVKVCGRFELTSVQKTTLRVFYEQSITATPTAPIIYGDRSAGDGQRDIHVEVEMLTQGFPLPFFFNTVSSSAQAGTQLLTAQIDGTGTPSVVRQDGVWISSITDNADGDWDVVYTTSFSSLPNCFCQVLGATPQRACLLIPAGTTVAKTQLKIVDSTTGVPVDETFNFSCIAPK